MWTAVLLSACIDSDSTGKTSPSLPAGTRDSALPDDTVFGDTAARDSAVDDTGVFGLGVEVGVDFGHVEEPVPPVFGFSFMSGGHTGDAAAEILSNSLSTVRLSLGWTLRSASSEDEAVQLVTDSGYVEGVDWALSQGAVVVLCIPNTPLFLSSCPEDTAPIPEDSSIYGYNVCPPASMEQYSAFWQRMANMLGAETWYEVGNEPDIFFFSGTREQYGDMYVAAATGVRSAHPKARVGGPAVSNFTAGRTEVWARDGWIDGLIEHAAGTPIADLGLDATPIDFVSYHQFTQTAHSGQGWQTESVRTTLAEHGYPIDTPIVIDEWNSSVESGARGELNDSEYNAAFVVARLKSWHEMGLDRSTFAVSGDFNPDPPEFHGGQGLVTQSGIRKPVYHALALMGQLDGDLARVEERHSSPFVQTVASVSSAGGMVVIANSIGTEDLLPSGDLWDSLLGSSQPENVYNELVKLDEKTWTALADGTADPSGLGLSAEGEAAIQAWVDAATAIETYGQSPTSVSAQVLGLEPGWAVSAVRIDKTTSNAYRVYQSTLASGEGEAAAVAAASKADNLESVPVPSIDSEGRFTVELEPDSVLVLRWE